ncbi:tetratricopeptide repeat protein [Cohnella hashimotonis]|uniref:Tetratricopeptide repeat protein n=1 Tax=Cohnella hashimotonis TaxID=2826895 RepID=A0ABT6TDH6_9BACL|nr:tetratricopeptide repeat protein [Cohnella hashimotonis]MDI4643902.1 tetratricopeptide repeat protein [Cohnella hashimotonis]
MDRLTAAIQLRESGKLEEARSVILELLQERPSDASVWYQCAWIHDALGIEREAVPFYKKALQLGLTEEERKGALLGLGSTYRTLGMYDEAQSLFVKAIQEYPDRREYQVFHAMVLYNRGEFRDAMAVLLKQLAETSTDEGIQSYKKAILFYSDKLDQTWS